MDYKKKRFKMTWIRNAIKAAAMKKMNSYLQSRRVVVWQMATYWTKGTLGYEKSKLCIAVLDLKIDIAKSLLGV